MKALDVTVIAIRTKPFGCLISFKEPVKTISAIVVPLLAVSHHTPPLPSRTVGATGNSMMVNLFISCPIIFHGTCYEEYHQEYCLNSTRTHTYTYTYIHCLIYVITDIIAVSVTRDANLSTQVTVTLRPSPKAITTISDRNLNRALWRIGNKGGEQFDLLFSRAPPLDSERYVVLRTRLSGGAHNRGE